MAVQYMSGDAIESALEIIDENGGLGAWEDAEQEPPVQRWSFPRFKGAKDPGDMYLSRPGIGSHDTDVETVAAWMQAPRNIVGGVMLLGEPGTGKTALVEAAATWAERTLTTHICTPDDTRESLTLRFVGEGNGDKGTPFVLGPLSLAAKKGHWFYADEFMLTPDGVKPIYYQLADGRRVLSGADVDGGDIVIHKNFRLIVSSNPQVRGASLPEPVASRFASTTLTVETSASLLRAMGIDDAIVSVWENLRENGNWLPQIREMRLADYWLDVDAAQAVSALVPEHCPESQRATVRDTAVAHLGSDIRQDGRLVIE